jgi:small-conductance mechanosensitive channel
MGAETAAEPAAEAAAETPMDPAEVLGTWWAELTQPETLTRIVNGAVGVLFIIVVTAIVYGVAMLLLRRAIGQVERTAEEAVEPQRRRQQRVVTVLSLLRSIIRWVMLIAASMWVLAAAGINIGPLLAGAGIAGLAIGFGSQNLVRDVVSGVFVLLEGQYAVGDYVQIGANFGLVEDIGVRVTVLKDLDNQRHYIPNGTIAMVTVYEEPFVNFIVETPIADPPLADRAVEAIDQVASKAREDYDDYVTYIEPATSVRRPEGALVRLPLAVFPTQEWVANEEIPQRIREALAASEIALTESRNIRTYADLSRMPEYRYEEEAGDDA